MTEIQIPARLQNPLYRFVKTRGKSAFEKEWSSVGGANYQFDDPKLIEWLKQGNNYGIQGGYGNLLIIDFDDEEYIKKYAPLLPATFTIKTGSGKIHKYYNCLKPQSFSIRGKIDIIGIGKQAVCVGSIHPDTNKPYEILENKPIAYITLEKIKEIFEIKQEDAAGIIPNPIIKNEKDNTKSGVEYRKVISLIKQGFSKEQIYKEMRAYSKWTTSSKQYKELTYSKAFKYCQSIKKERETGFKQKIARIKSLETYRKEGIPKIKWCIENILPIGGITILGGTAGSMKTWCGMQAALASATGTDFLNQFKVQQGTVLYIDEENGFITTPSRFGDLIKGHELNDYVFDNLQISISNGLVLDSIEGKNLLCEIINEYNPKLIVLDSMVRFLNGDENKASDVKNLFTNIKVHLEKGISFIILHHTIKNPSGKGMSGLRGSGDFAAFADSILMITKGREGYCNVKTEKNRHLAVEELGEFFCKLETVNDGLRLEWKGMSDADGNIIERCAKAIETWIQDDGLDEFESKNSSKLTQSQSYSKNCHYDALKLLVEKGILTKLKRGRYKVNTIKKQAVQAQTTLSL